MKNIKKSVLLLGVGLILFAPLASLVPVLNSFINPVSAEIVVPVQAGSAPYNNDSLDERVRAYLAINALAECIEGATLSDQGVKLRINDNNAANWQWYKDKILQADESEMVTGYMANPNDDGKENCSDSSKLKSLYGSIGWGDSALEAICKSGFIRVGPSSDQDLDTCINNSGGGNSDFERNGSNKDAAKIFIRNVNAEYYGTDSGSPPNLTKEEEYWYFWRSLQVLCGGQVVADQGDAEIAANNRLLKVTTPDGKASTIRIDRDQSDDVNIRSKHLGDFAWDDDRLSCKQIADEVDRNGRPAAYTAYVDNNPDEANDPALNTNGATPEIECSVGLSNVASNPLDWLTCAAVKGLYQASTVLEGVIVGMLCINETDIFEGAELTCGGAQGEESSQDGFYNAWNVFRIMALAFIAIAGLVMVISQALGFEFIDAYTVKKVLPRIIIAGIAISLSWPLLEFFVTLSNAFGVGIRNLIYTPFKQVQLDGDFVSIGDVGLTTLFAGGAMATLGAFGLLSFIGTAALALLIAFIILVLRNIIIILLVILAPLAIAMYVLPNTEKYYKTWWDWLSKGLMVFPIIAAMIAVGHVFAAVTLQKDGALSTFIAFFAYFAPYFLIPVAFRFAGGALSTIGGFTNNSSRGAFDRLSKFRQGQSAKNMAAMQSGTRYQGTKYIPGSRRAAGAFNTTTAGVSTGVAGRFGVGDRGAEALDQKRRIAAQELMKDSRFIGIKDDDNALRALTYDDYDSARAGLIKDFGQSEKEADRAVNSARASALGFGRPQAIAAAQQLINTGTGYDNIEQMTETLSRASGGNSSTAAGLAGFANSVTKSAGRHDLAPGFGTLNDAVQAQVAFKNGQGAALTGETYDNLRDNAWRSASLYQHANDKPKNIEAAIGHHTKMLDSGIAEHSAAVASGNAEQRQAAEAKLEKAAVFFSELKSMQGNAGGDVAVAINEALGTGENGRGDQVYDVINNRLSKTPSSPSTAKQARDLTGDPIPGYTRQETGKERVDRLARGYERPDPNNM